MAARLLTPASPQERAIAAGDQSASVLHEVDRHVAKGGSLPRRIGDAGGAEDGFGDFAVARAFRVTVDRLKHPSNPPALLLGQSCVDRHLPGVDGAPKTADRVDAVESISAEGDQCHKRVRRRGVGCEEESNGVRAAAVNNAQPVWAGAGRSRIKIRRDGALH